MNTATTSERARVRRIESQQELLELHAAAAEDNHVVVAATHVVEKAGEIIGYGSIGSVMMLNVWIHSQKGRARDSLTCLREAERLATEQGQTLICMPCAQNSPFIPHIRKLGYTPLGWSSFNLKRL